MRRYWIESDSFEGRAQGDFLKIAGDSFHHICDVCRQSVGDQFEVLSDGQAYLVEIKLVEKKYAKAAILSTRKIPDIKKPWIHLCVSISKFATMDLIVEKAVELGVYSFRPFVSDLSFVRSEKSERLENKIERWERIVKSATQQCGRGDRMQVYAPVTLENLVNIMNQSAGAAGLFPYEGASAEAMPQTISKLKAKKPEEIWVFIGSEGGFSRAEVEYMSSKGMVSTTLGDQVLRVETACMSVVSILKYEFNLSQG